MRTVFTNTLSVIASVAITTAIVASSAPAHADTAPMTQRVHYDQRDLATPDGRAAIAHRIAVAADQVCAPLQSVDRFSETQCRFRAIADADKTLDARQLASR